MARTVSLLGHQVKLIVPQFFIIVEFCAVM